MPMQPAKRMLTLQLVAKKETREISVVEVRNEATALVAERTSHVADAMGEGRSIIMTMNLGDEVAVNHAAAEILNREGNDAGTTWTIVVAPEEVVNGVVGKMMLRKADDERILVTGTWAMTRKEMKTLPDTAMHGLC